MDICTNRTGIEHCYATVWTVVTTTELREDYSLCANGGSFQGRTQCGKQLESSSVIEIFWGEFGSNVKAGEMLPKETFEALVRNRARPARLNSPLCAWLQLICFLPAFVRVSR